MIGSSLLSTLLLLLIAVLLARLTSSRLAGWAVPAIVLELLGGSCSATPFCPTAAFSPWRV